MIPTPFLISHVIKSNVFIDMVHIYTIHTHSVVVVFSTGKLGGLVCVGQGDEDLGMDVLSLSIVEMIAKVGTL